MPLELKFLHGCQTMALQDGALLLEQGVLVGDGDCHAELVVRIVLIDNAVVEQQRCIWLRPAPGVHRFTPFVGPIGHELHFFLLRIPCQQGLHIARVCIKWFVASIHLRGTIAYQAMLCRIPQTPSQNGHAQQLFLANLEPM